MMVSTFQLYNIILMRNTCHVNSVSPQYNLAFMPTYEHAWSSRISGFRSRHAPCSTNSKARNWHTVAFNEGGFNLSLSLPQNSMVTTSPAAWPTCTNFAFGINDTALLATATTDKFNWVNCTLKIIIQFHLSL